MYWLINNLSGAITAFLNTLARAYGSSQTRQARYAELIDFSLILFPAIEFYLEMRHAFIFPQSNSNQFTE